MLILLFAVRVGVRSALFNETEQTLLGEVREMAMSLEEYYPKSGSFVASRDLLGCECHGAQARTAKLIDAKGRVFHRNAGIHRSLTRWVLPRAGGQDLAQDHFVHFRTFNAGAFHGGLDGNSAQRMRG